MLTPREFLLRVLPWPGDDTPGYINVHGQCHFDGKTPWTGWPTRAVDAFLNAVHNALTWQTPPDLFMCMSRQADRKPDNKGNYKAAKSSASALAMKGIWADLDVKPKAYPTLGDAIDALTAFCAHYQLPSPTALVASGGGLHAHWVSDRELTPDEWQPYAEGLKAAMITFRLKCDAGLTADRARVLRIPGTFNYKIPGQPRPVRLLSMKDTNYDFATALAVLPPLAVLAPSRPAQTTIVPIAGGPSSAFLGQPVESLAEGISDPLDVKAIFKQCPHFQEALFTGGAAFSQGLWNLTTLAATFLEDGNALAHKMAHGHPGYSHGETEALWQRKLDERQRIHLGWPSCKSFQAEGCTHCATCPHLASGQSPLHLGRVLQVSQPIISVGPVTAAPLQQLSRHVGTVANGAVERGELDLIDANKFPPNFMLRNDRIHRIVTKQGKGNNGNTTEYVQVFNGRLYNEWCHSGPSTLHFITTLDKGSHGDVTLTRGDLISMKLEWSLAQNEVSVSPPYVQYAKEFLVNWLSQLNEAAAAEKTAPFGWFMKGEECLGFSYGSILYRADGSIGPAGILKGRLKEMYEPKGTVEPWMDAFKVISDQQRPGLEAIVAASLGSPLMKGSGEYVGMFSVYGETGAFKSTAMRVAVAIWGNPKLAKETEGATDKSVMIRLGMIRNLPFMWDEIKDEIAQKRVYTVLYRSQGKDNSRGTPTGDLQEAGTWENIIGIAANRSFADFIIRENPNTEAGLVRLFEWKEMKPARGAPGVIPNPGDVGRLMYRLDTNYGQIGRAWAGFLGANHDLCMAAVKTEGDWFVEKTRDPDKQTQDERFWIAFCASTVAAAKLANEHLFLNFNVEAIRYFLLEKLKDQRKNKSEDSVEGGSLIWTEDRLGWFLDSCVRETLRTQSTTRGVGAPAAPGHGLLSVPEKGYATKVHWVVGLNELRFSKKEFDDWLVGPTIKCDPRQMKNALSKHFQATVQRLRLGAGTSYSSGQAPAYVIPVLPNTPLWEAMHKKEDTNGQGQAQTQASQAFQAGVSERDLAHEPR